MKEMNKRFNEVKMKKTCNGCKALHFEGKSIVSCDLHFKFDDKFSPLEECPKPLTYKKLVENLMG